MENNEIQGIFSALGSNRRRYILAELAVREISVTDIANIANLTKAGASQYLSQLKAAHLVLSEKRLKSVFYRLDAKKAAYKIHEFVDNILRPVQRNFREPHISRNEYVGSNSLQSALKAMCCSHRRLIVTVLGSGELSVEDLAAQCNLSRESTSFHLTVLRKANLVTFAIRPPKHIYRLIPETIFTELHGYATELLSASGNKN